MREIDNTYIYIATPESLFSLYPCMGIQYLQYPPENSPYAPENDLNI
jgi:hypothetical protein